MKGAMRRPTLLRDTVDWTVVYRTLFLASFIPFLVKWHTNICYCLKALYVGPIRLHNYDKQ